MAATGFAYAPNEALQARMAHLAAEGKLVLGDAQDDGLKACLLEASFKTHPKRRRSLPAKICKICNQSRPGPEAVENSTDAGKSLQVQLMTERSAPIEDPPLSQGGWPRQAGG